MSNISLPVNPGESKTLTFNTADTYMPENLVFNIEGDSILKTVTGTGGNGASGSYLSAKWRINDTDTELYDGRMIMLRVPVVGASTAGVVLSIDNGTEVWHPVVFNKNTVLTTQYVVNSTIILIYNENIQKACYLTSNTSTTITGVWQAIGDYDSADTLQQINAGKKIMVITGVDGVGWTAGDAMTGQASSDLTYDFDNKILSSPALQLTNVQSGTPVTNGYLALDSGNNVIKTGAPTSSDIKVTQSNTTATSYYPVILKYNTSTSGSVTNTVKYGSGLLFNAGSQVLQVGSSTTTGSNAVGTLTTGDLTIRKLATTTPQMLVVGTDGIVSSQTIESPVYYIDVLTTTTNYYIPATVSTTAYDDAITALNNGRSVVLRWVGMDYSYEYAYLLGYDTPTTTAVLHFTSISPRCNTQTRRFIWTYTVHRNNANITSNKWTSVSLLRHPTSTSTLSGTRYVTMKYDFDSSMSSGHTEYDYETFVYSSGTVGSISITNINSDNLGTQKYFKIINNSNSAINVSISGTNLKGGGTFRVNAQSLVEFSCIVTYGTSNSVYWGILTHSENISI